MKSNYGSWREDAPADTGWDIGYVDKENKTAVKIGFMILIWLGLCWAGVAWLVLWSIRSSGFTSFDVSWKYLAPTAIAITFVRMIDKRIGK